MFIKNRNKENTGYLLKTVVIMSLIISISFLKCLYDEKKSNEEYLKARAELILQKVGNAIKLFKHLELRLFINKNDEEATLSILKANHNGQSFGKTFNIPLDATFNDIKQKKFLSPYGKGTIRTQVWPEFEHNKITIKTSKNYVCLYSLKEGFITTINFSKEELGLYENEDIYSFDKTSDLLSSTNAIKYEFSDIEKEKTLYNYSIVDLNNKIIFLGHKTNRNILNVYLSDYLFFIFLCLFLCLLWIGICRDNYKKLHYKLEKKYKKTLKKQDHLITNIEAELNTKISYINKSKKIESSLKEAFTFDAQLKHEFFLFHNKILSRILKKHQIVLCDLSTHISKEPSLQSTHELALNMEADLINLDLVFDEGDQNESVSLRCIANRLIDIFNVKAIENELDVNIAYEGDNLCFYTNKFVFEIALYNIFRNIFDRLPKNGKLLVKISKTNDQDLKIIIEDDGYALSSNDVQHITSLSRNIFKLDLHQLGGLLGQINIDLEEHKQNSPRVNKLIMTLNSKNGIVTEPDSRIDNILHFKR